MRWWWRRRSSSSGSPVRRRRRMRSWDFLHARGRFLTGSDQEEEEEFIKRSKQEQEFRVYEQEQGQTFTP